MKHCHRRAGVDTNKYQYTARLSQSLINYRTFSPDRDIYPVTDFYSRSKANRPARLGIIHSKPRDQSPCSSSAALVIKLL